MIDSIISKVMKLISKYIQKELNPCVEKTIIQFIRFGIVGISNTIISYVLYVVGLMIFRNILMLKSVDYLLAQAVAFVLSVLWSFYWNNRLVFQKNEGQERRIFRALIKTYISYSFTGLFLNSVLLMFWVQSLGISEFIAPAINLLISVPLNFIINKIWTFRA